ncbi:hypothetical protein [Specibacter cremeus]|uniref:hypothetical protein n=1 Tax=Specibacter cremeus TaxID=1629051 RepID=UPI000F7936C5|nr:hypothetical protein [Specibacter cremeus]
MICSQLGLVNPGSQDAELRVAGCVRILVDHEEPGRIAACLDWVAGLDYLRPGDVGLAPSPVADAVGGPRAHEAGYNNCLTTT